MRQWQAAQNTQAGEVLPARQVWELSRLWYANRLSPDYHGRSAAEAAVLFRAAGLTDHFWYLDETDQPG